MDKSGSFILASGSARRKGLLSEAGYEFKVVVSDVDEGKFSSEGVGAVEFAETLAAAKAESVAVRYPESLVLGADTLVDCDGQIIGKAEDSTHAEQIVRKLFSREHKVITGVAVIRKCDGLRIVRSDTTVVWPKKITDEQIAEHIRDRSWEDKAGAYAIQENGDQFIELIEGSLTNVMGLPMELIAKLLENI